MTFGCIKHEFLSYFSRIRRHLPHMRTIYFYALFSGHIHVCNQLIAIDFFSAVVLHQQYAQLDNLIKRNWNRVDQSIVIGYMTKLDKHSSRKHEIPIIGMKLLLVRRKPYCLITSMKAKFQCVH